LGTIVALIGGFGAALAVAGALMALFAGGLGFSSGADEAGSFTARAVGALLASFIGIAGALTARARLQLGAGLLIASAVLGLIFAFWFYLAAAVMLLAAAATAFWPASAPGESSDAR
jgi:hypothetical protein